MRLLPRIRQRLIEDPRLARMLHGGASGFLVRGLSMLISFISLPLSVRYLGKLEYGIWITISSSVVMLNVLDLGIANTLTNHISEAFAEEDKAKAQEYFATAFWMTAGVAAVLAALCFGVWHMVHWGPLLGIKDARLAGQARMCVAVSAFFLLASLPLNLANRVLSGYQQVHIGNYFQMLNSLLGLGAIVAVVLARGSLVAMMVSYCGALFAGSIILNGWLLLWAKPWMVPDPRRTHGGKARSLFGQGALFFVLQITSVVVFNTDNLVITHFRGPAEVTPYSIAWRLVSYATLFQLMLVPSFWPAFTEAYRKREMTWVRETYRSMVRKTMLIVTLAAVAIGLLGRPVIHAWAGAAAVPGSLLLWSMAAWAIVSSMTTNQALLLTATSRLKVEAGVAVAAAVLNLALSVILVRRIGPEGVILSTIVSFVLLMLGPQQWEVRRVLEGRYLPLLSPHGSGGEDSGEMLLPALHEETT